MLSESVLSVRKELFPQNKTAVSDMPKVNIQKKVQPTDADMVQTSLSFENIYYSLWEIAGRYSSFCQFRVIGNSHDERMIPMLEVGTGAQMIFCVAGINGTQALLPELLLKMAGEYCRAYECGRKLDEFYEVKKLLDKIRICLFPISARLTVRRSGSFVCLFICLPSFRRFFHSIFRIAGHQHTDLFLGRCSGI